MHRTFRILQALVLIAIATGARAAELVPLDAAWRFLPGIGEASSPDIRGWRLPGFDDSSWTNLPAPFWYGDAQSGPGTELPQMRYNYRCIFTRREFTVTNPADVSSLTLGAQSDDGFIAWINGREVARFNMPDGEVTIGNDALGALPEPIPFQTFEIANPRDFLVAGRNVIAVQAFNASIGSSSDFVLNVSLAALGDSEPPIVETLQPPAGAEIRSLDSIEVLFNEPVRNVDAGDLLLHGQPATNVTVYTDRQYVFTFPKPSAGTLAVAWAASHGITDQAGTPHAFAGGSWTYRINPNLPLPGIILSEIVTDNARTLNDEDGDSSDWIELRNTSTAAVNLGGWFLTVDTNLVNAWRLPAVTLGASGYRLVFASGKNRTNPAAPLHTHFKLPKSGGFLALLDPGRNIVSEFRYYPPQSTDVSYGRDHASPTVLGFFPQPTPGAQNSTGGAGFAPPVSFNRPGGTFIAAFGLTLSTPIPAAEIRYTTDGTVPSQASPLWTTPLSITNSTLLRARAFQSGLLPGPVHTEGYILLGSGLINTSSDLPLVILHNFGTGAFPAGNPDKPGFIAVFEPHANGRSSMTNAADFTSRVGANIRGSSTEGYPKSSYALEMWEEVNEDADKPLLGMPSESDWVLYAPNSFEPVLIHNPFAHALSRQIGRYSPRTRFAEVYVNTGAGPTTSGHYMGLYVVEEKVKRSPNRVDIDALQPDHTLAPAVTGGYLMKIDRSDPDERVFGAAGQAIVYQYPAGPDIQDLPQRQPQEDYLTSYLNAYYSKLYSNDWTNTLTGYRAYIDVEAAIDHHLLNVLTFNVDALRLSGYFHKPRDGKITFGPLWDFDRALGSTDGRDANPRVWRSAVQDRGTDFFNYTWWDRMFQDPEFWQGYVDRYQDLRLGWFSTTNLHALVDRLSGEIRQAQPREVTRWNAHTPRGGSYQAEVNLLKTWLSNRVDFMDTNFLARPRLSAPGGSISSGTLLTVTPASRSGTYVIYTLDGTDPRLPGGAAAAGARSNLGPATLSLTNNARLMARSFHPSHRNLTGANNPPISTPWSGLAEATYVVTPPPLAITEILFHPAPAPAGSPYDADAFEYVELRNTGAAAMDLRGMRIEGGIRYHFTNSFVLKAGAWVVIPSDPDAFASRYGTHLVVAPGSYAGRLANNGDHLLLLGPLGEVIQDFSFEDDWFLSSDGPGFSLVAVDEQAPPEAWSTSAQWRPSAAQHGSPGAADATPPTFPRVLINEALTHTDPPLVDYLELYNAGTTAADIGGWFLTDDLNDPAKFRIPEGTMLPGGGFALFTGPELSGGAVPFLLSSLGDQVWIISAHPQTGNLTGYIHGFDFGAAQNSVPFGRFTDSLGRDHFVAQSAPSAGAPNASPRVGPIVISELMVDPRPVLGTNNNTRDEYVEIRNVSAEPVALFDPAAPTNTWSLDGAIQFTFPQGITLPPGGHIIVVGFDPVWSAIDTTAFRTNYSLATNIAILGPFKGNLNNSGEVVRLHRPDPPQGPGPDEGFVPQILVESVRYQASAPWPTNANATGLSLHRVPGSGFADDPANWTAGPPSPGAPADAPPIAFTSCRLIGPGQVAISWTSEPGRTYRLEARGDLSSGSWESLGELTATSGSLSFTDFIAGNSRRYYRVGQK
jgi:hypothetical protein